MLEACGQEGSAFAGCGWMLLAQSQYFYPMRLNKSQDTSFISPLLLRNALKPTDKVFGVLTIQAPTLRVTSGSSVPRERVLWGRDRRIGMIQCK